VTATFDPARYRWWIVAVFVLSTAINYLDRQSLATLAPLLRADFHLSREQYGWILGAFSITYAAGAPFAGLLIDRIGLTRGISLAVGFWSCAGIATGFTGGLGGLVGCRAVLGAAEAGGIPSAGKAIHAYLRPPERALGNAVNQAGVSLGAILAPPLATWIAWRHGWRMAFVTTGILGLIWIPIWNWVARHSAPSPGGVREIRGLSGGAARAVEPQAPRPGEVRSNAEMLRDRRLWAFVAANALSMVGYSLWSNWTTQYLVDQHHLTIQQAARYAWIPPLVAMGGGFAGGWFSLRLMRGGMAAPAARFRVCLAAALLSLATAAIPRAPTAAWASAGISLSIFAVSAFSVNTYTLPLDTFGGARAAFAVSLLVASYGAIQLVISPAFGAIADRHGYAPVTAIAAFTPLAACAVLWGSRAVR
jgi:ACS family hexuronate transporter-like MFS transporter